MYCSIWYYFCRFDLLIILENKKRKEEHDTTKQNKKFRSDKINEFSISDHLLYLRTSSITVIRPPSSVNQQLMQTRNSKKIEKQLEILTNRINIVNGRS